MSLTTLHNMLKQNWIIYKMYTDYVEDERTIYKITINEFDEMIVKRELEESGYEYEDIIVKNDNLIIALRETLTDLENVQYNCIITDTPADVA